jgi:Ca-activated chloride channel family protein
MFRFEHPEFLWLLTAFPGVVLLAFWYAQWRKSALARLGQTAGLMNKWSLLRYWTKFGLLGLSLGCLSIAWANPQWGARKQQSVQESADVFILMDISQSMLCRDVSPSRLELSRIFTQKLTQSLEGERIGVIFFAGNAFLGVPLSTDYPFIIQSLQSAHPDLLTEQGTAIASALELAQKSFDTESGGGRGIVLITDGENHDEEAVEMAKKLNNSGITIVAVGAGKQEGGPIPLGDWEGGQYKRDDNGEIVVTRLNEDLLRKIAQAGGGGVFNIQQGDRSVEAVTRSLNSLEKRALEVRSFDEPESWYQWFLLPAILLLGLEAIWSNWKKNS